MGDPSLLQQSTMDNLKDEIVNKLVNDLGVDSDKVKVTPSFTTEVVYKIEGLREDQVEELKKSLAASFGVPVEDLKIEIQGRRLQEHGEGHLRNLQSTDTVKVTITSEDPAATKTIAAKAADSATLEGTLQNAGLPSNVEITEQPSTQMEMVVAFVDEVLNINVENLKEVAANNPAVQEVGTVMVDQGEEEEEEEEESSAPQGGIAFAVAVTACIAAVVATEGL